MSSQLSKLNVPDLYYDGKMMDIFTQHNVLVCGVEIEETKKGTIYINLYFDGKPFKYYEDDISEATINDDIKFELLKLFEDYREIQEQRNQPDPDHQADLIREWKEEN